MPVAPEPIQEITDLPLSTDPVNFDERADQSWTELKQSIEDQNAENLKTYGNALEVFDAAEDISAAALVATNAAGLVGKMTGSLTHGAGTKAITLAAAKPELAVAGKQVAIVLESDPTIKMFGVIPASPAPTSTTFSVTVTSGGVFPTGGAGTLSGWKIIDAAFFGASSTAVDIWAGETEVAGITPKAQTDAWAPVPITWASTLVVNLKQGRRRQLSASASFTLGVPTNAKAGQGFYLDVLNTAGSIVLALNAIWDTKNALLPVLKPDNGARNKIFCMIDEVDGSGNATRGTVFVIPGLG